MALLPNTLLKRKSRMVFENSTAKNQQSPTSKIDMDNKQKQFRKKTKIIWKGFVLRLFFLLVILGLSYGSFVFYKLYRFQQKIVVMAENNGENNQHQGIIETAKNIMNPGGSKLRGEEDGRINILLLGMGGEGHKGKYLTDTIMLVSVDPVSYKSAMLSIPRDLYVEIADSNVFTKINAIYAYEMKNQNTQGRSFGALKETIKNITGQRVDYYVAIDFDGFKKVIDEVGGIEVEVENDIYDPSYPGPNYSYETFEIKKGFHHLDAETALKYARVRHTQGGDFGRAARQQQVIAATKRKALSLGTLMNPTKVSSLLETMGEHLKTDIQLAEIPSFLHLANNINIYQTTSRVLDAWSENALLASTHVELGGVSAYVLMPRAKNYSQIHELSENILDWDVLEKKAAAIKQEQAKINFATDKKTNNSKIINIMKKFGYQTSALQSTDYSTACSTPDTIVSHSQTAKLFTLDDLAKKLEMEIVYDSQNDASSDITLCLSNDLVLYFENQQEENREDLKQSIIDEEGNILINKK